MESWTSQTDNEVWNKVREILVDALDKAPEERKTFIDHSCQGDASLRAEIESLIEASQQPSFIDHPATEALTVLQSAARSTDDFEGIGRHVGHYELVAKIGQGGMGAVFKAVDLNLDRFVALKVLSLGHERYEDKQRFAREAKAASALNHPNIVTIYEFGSQDDFDFIAMEYVEGSTLHDVLAHRREPLPKLLDYARQAAGALAKAHSAGIVHRDLKPANFMITPDGVVKILDFGLASLVRPEQTEIDPNATRRQELTRAGTIMGTPPYMSPEQAMGERTDFRTDIFSFGSMLYEIICGERPFGGNSAHLTLHQVAMENPKPITELNPQAPAELVALVERCLCKDREQRPQSMAEVHQVLGGTATVMRMAPVVVTPVAPVQNGSRRTMMVAGLVGLIAVSIGLLAYRWPTAQTPAAPAATAALGNSFSYSIEVQKFQKGKPTGDTYVASAKDMFQGGWKFRIVMQSPEPGFLYLINQGPDESGRKRYYILHPYGGNEGRAALPANQSERTDWNRFDENPGTERLWIVWSAKPLPAIEEQLRGAGEGIVETLAAASAVDTVLSGLKQGQRTETAGQIRVAMTDRVVAFAEMLELAHR